MIWKKFHTFLYEKTGYVKVHYYSNFVLRVYIMNDNGEH